LASDAPWWAFTPSLILVIALMEAEDNSEPGVLRKNSIE
jgi:hypothetical protein